MPQDPYAAIAQPVASDPYAAIAMSNSLDLKDARTIPNSRIRNMTVDPTKDVQSGGQALYEGAKTGLTLGMIPTAPSAIAAPVSTLLGVGGGAVGGVAGKEIAKAAGAGDFGQEVGGDVGGLTGGILSGAAGEAALSKARSIYGALPEPLQKQLLGVASPRLKNAIRLWDALKELGAPKPSAPVAELDATGENVDYAGEKPPKPSKPLDATGENKPFAGGMDEWIPPRAKVPAPSNLAPVAIPSPMAVPQATPVPIPTPTVPPGSAGSLAASVAKSAPAAIAPNDPLLVRLRQIAAKIEADESAPKETAPRTRRPSAPAVPASDDDLLDLLHRSLNEITQKAASQ